MSEVEVVEKHRRVKSTVGRLKLPSMRSAEVQIEFRICDKVTLRDALATRGASSSHSFRLESP